MCGLVWVKRKDGHPAYKAVLKRYRSQQGRGQNGFGYIAIQNNKVVSYQRAATEHEIVKLLEKEKASEIMFHHRFPTSTPNIEEAAHPLLVENEKLHFRYFILHNGVIRNTKELRENHYKLGFQYKTEIMKGFTALTTRKNYMSELIWNDSESLAIETALALEGMKPTIDTFGPAAVMGVQATAEGQVISRFFFRNDGHPLMVQDDKHMFSVTSLGAGRNLPSNLVQSLLDDYKHEHYGDKPILVPRTYVSSGGTSVPPFGVDVGDWYKGKIFDPVTKMWIPKTEEKVTRTIHVTHPINRRRERCLVKTPGEILLPGTVESKKPILHFEDEDPVPTGNEAEIEMAELEDLEDELNVIQRRIRKDDFLKKMPLNVLWEEYLRADEMKATLMEVLEKADSIMENISPSDEMVQERQKYQLQLESVESYMAKLEPEITFRESMLEGFPVTRREEEREEEFNERLFK